MTYYEDASDEERAPYDAMVREALDLPPGDERRRELARLCRVGAYRPTPADWPEFSPAQWRDAIMYLRGRTELSVGDHVCIDRENFASVWTVRSVEERQVEDDDYEETGRMVRRTKIHCEAYAIDGDYAVLPGADTIDLADRIVWARSVAECEIRKI